MERTVGQYRLGDSLGALPFGELVTATHTARSEPLAVLLLDDRLAKDHRFRGLLRLEIARAGGLRHPAIARTVEVGEHSGALYVVVERPADARSLATLLADDAQSPNVDTVALVRTLAEGLDAAHGRRLVHGAITPDGVLLGANGGAALVGTGLLAAVEEAGLGAVLAERTDTAYVGPEQQSGRRAVASADGYALGVLAAALLGPSAQGQDDAVAAVLARQTSADPAARFPTCAAFATALADAIAPTIPADAGAPPSVSSAASTPILPVERPSIEPPAAPEPASAATAEPEPALPWDAPARKDEPSTAERPNPPVEPWTVEPPPAPAAPAPPAARSGGWLQAAIDPPQPARPVERTAAADTGVTVDNLALTPAMAELLKPEPPRDLIGDAVHLLGDRFPAINDLIERHTRDGKVGPLPLGVAVAGGITALLILVGQFWPATVVFMTVVVLYGVPKLGAALTASERSNPHAARVTGTAQVKRPPDAIGAGSPELILPTGGRLGLRASECDTLIPFGRPVTVERPAYGTTGVVNEVVHHDLAGVAVTYITPNQILLDVRNVDGTVIYRRPPYQGEPGDHIWSPADRPEATAAPSPPTASRPAAHGQPMTLPMPPAAQAALVAATQSEYRKASMILGGGVVALIALPLFIGGFGFIGFFAFLGIVVLKASTLLRAYNLWNARDVTSMVRIVGPVSLMEYRSGKSHSYAIHLADGTHMKIDSDTHRALAYAGEIRVKQPEIFSFFDFDHSRQSSDGYLQTQYEIPGATTTYLPGGPLILEVVNPFGDTVYRDPALKEGDLGPIQPRV